MLVLHELVVNFYMCHVCNYLTSWCTLSLINNQILIVLSGNEQYITTHTSLTADEGGYH